MNKAWQVLTITICRGVCAILLLLGVSQSVFAQGTPTPTLDPSRQLHINLLGSIAGTPLPPGTIITAIGPNGIPCGNYEIDAEGHYGFLTCTMDDPATSFNEGVRAGDQVTLYVNGGVVGSVTLPEAIKSGDRFDAPVSVPEPISIVLFGTGLAGLATYGSWRKRRGQQGGSDDSVSA